MFLKNLSLHFTSCSEISSVTCKMMRLGLACFLILAFGSCCYSCNKYDLESLMSLSFTSPANPLNWSTSTDCCLWEGIYCDQNGRVSHLELPSRGLKGKISPFLGNLTYLSHLQLSHNLLCGPLPDILFSSLTRLEKIDLSFNSLSGEVASSLLLPSSVRVVDFSSNHLNGTILSTLFKEAPNLVSFNASNNSFVGNIPSSFCSNSSLINFLDFSYNEFSGEIPHGFGKCGQLEVFRAGSNILKGLLPDDIYNVSTLSELSLPENNLYGPIGAEVVQCFNLTVLNLQGNELTGKIPQNIGKLFKLQQLRLNENNLSGHLPLTLTNCINLITVNLRVNFLDGDITAFDFSKLSRLCILDLGYNHLTGKLPGSLFMCKSLVAVRLSNNYFIGEIPASVSELQSLSFISLSNNSLTNITGAVSNLMGCKSLTIVVLSLNFFGETLPDGPSIVNRNGFENVRVLGLGGCQFFGNLPTWMERLKELEVIDLSVNQFSGKIPSWFGSLPKLLYLDLSSNLFSGVFPRELSTLQSLTLQQSSKQVKQFSLELPILVNPHNGSLLQYTSFSFLPPTINLRNNSLNGNIPAEIGRLKLLHVLELSMNKFTGEIPDQISALTDLERLDLSDNQLSGKIPSSLKALNFLSWFSAANNKLTGQIPRGNQLESFLASSYTGNPGLCGFPLPYSCDLGSDDGEHNEKSIEEEDDVDIQWFYVIVGIGYVTGLFLVSFTLLCHTSWRNAYFKFLTDLIDCCYTKSVIIAVRFQTKLQVAFQRPERRVTDDGFPRLTTEMLFNNQKLEVQNRFLRH